MRRRRRPPRPESAFSRGGSVPPGHHVGRVRSRSRGTRGVGPRGGKPAPPPCHVRRRTGPLHMKQLYHIFTSMRPHQWTKNLVIFAGLIFSRNFHQKALLVRSVEAFVVFCLLSGVIYIINDIADIEKDRLHPTKRNRPLAAGALAVPVAFVAAVVGAALGLFMSWRLGSGFLTVACVFCALNLLYSFLLKRIVLLDVVSISLSFVLRAIAGVEALRDVEPSIAISPWLLICTLFLSLFLAFCKRRYELTSLENAADHRESLQEYSPILLDQLVGMTAGGSVIAYAI